MNPARVLALFFLTASLAACGIVLDTDQARVCRLLLPAFHESGVIVAIERQTALPPQGSLPGLAIDYRAGTEAHHVECRFGGADFSPLRRDLAAVTLDGRALPETQLALLKRFWLATPEASLAEPDPLGRAALPVVPHWLAYTLQQGANALPLAAIYGLLAAAYSLVYGLIGRINLAFGALAVTGGYAALFGVAMAISVSPAAALALSLVLAASTAAFHGIVSGRVIAGVMARAPDEKGRGQQALVATVGLALFLQEYLILTQGVGLRWISPLLSAPVALARAGDFVVTVTPLALFAAGVAALAAAGLIATMRLSRFGRDWRAYADDAGAAVLFGVDPAAIYMRSFALASALAGLSGYVMTVFYGGVGYGAATMLGLKALVAAILGGIGSIPGAFLGGIAVGALEAIWSAAFPIDYRDLVTFAVLAVTLMFRPGGFLGWRDLTPRRV